MDGFQRRLSAFIRTVKSVQYEDVQNLVREATSNDPVSAPDELIWKVIHAASMGSNNYALISEILWKRIGDIAHPLHVYKALTLLYHLLQHGDNKNIFREDSKGRIHEIRELKNYTYFKNEGSLVNDIRRAAATIEDMLLNPNKVVEKPSSSEVKSAAERDASPHKNNVAKASPRTDDDQKRASAAAAAAAAPRRPSTKETKPKKAKEEEEPEPEPAKPASKPRKKSSVDKTAEADLHASRSGSTLAPPGGPSEAHRHRGPNPNAPPMPIDIINSGAMPVTPVEDVLALAFNSPPQHPPRQFAGNPFEAIPVTDPSVQGQPFEEFDQNPWAEAAQPKAQRKASPQPRNAQYNNLLGDEWGSEFERLEEKTGGGAIAFTSFEPEYAAVVSKKFSPSVHAVPQQAVISSVAKPAELIQHVAAPAVVPSTAIVSKPLVTIPATMLNELGVYARFINAHLQADADLRNMKYIPLAADGSDLFAKIEDGVVLAKLINVIAPGTIDERALNLQIRNAMEKQQNVNLVLNAIQSLGVRTYGLKHLDLTKGAPAKTVMTIVGSLVKTKLLERVSVRAHPELVHLLSYDEEKTEPEQLISLSPENLLLKWFHYHLKKQGRDTPNIDLKNSEAYAHLMNSLVHTMTPESYPPPELDVEALIEEGSFEERARQVLAQSREMGVLLELQPNDIVGGNPRLNLMFTAALFNVTTGVSHAELVTPKHKEHLAVIEKAGRLADDVGASREERAFRMWINSLGLDDVFVNSLSHDLADGLVLLKLLNHIEPGIVDWKKVEAHPTSVFKRVSNCNYAIELGKKLGFSLVGVGGQDLVEHNSKLTLAYVWQLMRHHVLKFVGEVRKSKFGVADKNQLTDTQIIEWANQRLTQSQQQMRQQGLTKFATTKPITGFNDKTLCDGRFLLDLLWSIEPRVIDWALVTTESGPEARMLNASYAISVARKLGATVFLLPEDIVEVKAKMLYTFVAAIMALS